MPPLLLSQSELTPQLNSSRKYMLKPHFNTAFTRGVKQNAETRGVTRRGLKCITPRGLALPQAARRPHGFRKAAKCQARTSGYDGVKAILTRKFYAGNG
jgi:hypothetical protein